MRPFYGLIVTFVLTTTALAGNKSSAVAGGELQFVAHYCHLGLTPAAKAFLAKAYKANPRLFDAQYASEEKGLTFDDNNNVIEGLACENWYGDYLKGGSSYLGFRPFVELPPE
ncbi:hypothetical protein X760_27800 [Mesorhizobium sp. LSHC422A00]|uniref:hypothetical protein n=1 Tax=Mesorhizobium sp. LSHC422A00 TaxID=1287294 RepID=UPI0003CE8FCC|nr:hypothetical protein [Mesorhizobium sp. LSHC422A00]ESX54724.1 hypothetical protein X760_27800 [Mesorhizobium sp. LSHC422A00]